MESYSEYVDAFNLRFINDSETDEIDTIFGIVDKLYDDSKKSRLKSLYSPKEKMLIKDIYEQTSLCREQRMNKNGNTKL